MSFGTNGCLKRSSNNGQHSERDSDDFNYLFQGRQTLWESQKSVNSNELLRNGYFPAYLQHSARHIGVEACWAGRKWADRREVRVGKIAFNRG
jgi:hypothetical protein